MTEEQMMPPPLEIAPEEPRSKELEAGVESSSPDRLLQSPRKPGTTLASPSGLARPPPPQPPLGSLRKVVCDCSGSDPKGKGKRRVRRACTGCIGSALRCACCLIMVGAAILNMIWSLFPLNTACDGVAWSDGTSSAVEIAAMGSTSAEDGVRPFSTLRINQLQVLGTHNSYHRRSSIPTISEFWPYDFSSISSQLDAGVRHLELDIHYDWKTGRWFVYHISMIDPLSSCHCLLSCLHEIREWSDLNPMHHILFMDIELKLTGDFLRICGEHTPDEDRKAFQALQSTIVGAFPPGRILTPQMVQGDYDTLFDAVRAGGNCAGGQCGSNVSSSISGEEAVGAVPGMAGGWPLVDDSRGMIAFVMDYQTINLACRDGIREALPDDTTVLFERIPLREVNKNSPYAAFTQYCPCDTTWYSSVLARTNRGFIVRQTPLEESWVIPGTGGYTSSVAVTGNETYLALSPAQLLVTKDMGRGVEKGGCRSRCHAAVPEEECVLEGFC